MIARPQSLWSNFSFQREQPFQAARAISGHDAARVFSRMQAVSELQPRRPARNGSPLCPTGSGQFVSLDAFANELSNRLIKSGCPDEKGERLFTCQRGNSLGETADRERYLLHEYFHGSTGAGLDASHQTGWTGLIARLIQQQGSRGTIVKPDPFTDF